MEILDSMTFFAQWLYLLAAFATSVLGIIVIRKKFRVPASKPLFSFSIFFILWLLSLYLGFVFLLPETREISLLFVRLSYGFGTLVMFSLVAFFYYFPHKKLKLHPLLTWGFFVLTIGLFLLTVTTPFVYEATEIIIPQEMGKDIVGDFYGLTVFYFLLAFGLAMWIAIQKYKKAHSIEREKIMIAGFGLAVFLISIILTNVILPIFGIIILQLESPVFSLAFFVPAFYSMVKYRFLDVRFTISQALKKTVAFSIGVGVVYFISLGGDLFLGFDPYSIWSILALLVGLLCYFYLVEFFNSEKFHRFFGQTNVEYLQKLVSEFSQQNKIFTSVSQLETRLRTLFCKNYGIKFLKVLSFLNNPQVHTPAIRSYFGKTSRILLVQEVPFLDLKEAEKIALIKEFHLLQAEACLPLFRGETLMGFFLLGKKRFGDLYSQNEISILEKEQRYLSLMLTGIVYNTHLQKEVEEKTAELREKHQELMSSHKKLKKLDQIKDDFLSIASHELRTPMTVIKGYSDFLLSQKFGKINEQQKDFLQKIFRNAEDLITLVGKMLEVSALEAGKMQFDYKTLAIKPFLEEIIDEFRTTLARQKKIKLTFEHGKDCDPLVKTDLEKIKRVMTNLLGNAFKFTPEKGSIVVKLEQKKKTIQISVQDTGPGISSEDQKNIFKKFQQGENYLRQAFTGTGLGLSISKGFIEHLGGKIWVKSKENEGACFIFELPLAS